MEFVLFVMCCTQRIFFSLLIESAVLDRICTSMCCVQLLVSFQRFLGGVAC